MEGKRFFNYFCRVVQRDVFRHLPMGGYLRTAADGGARKMDFITPHILKPYFVLTA